MSGEEGVTSVPTMLFTSMGTVPKARQRDFSGFGEEDWTVREAMMRRRIITLETEMKEMKDRFDKMEKMVETLITEKGVWRGAYDDLHKKQTLYEKKSKEYDTWRTEKSMQTGAPENPAIYVTESCPSGNTEVRVHTGFTHCCPISKSTL